MIGYWISFGVLFPIILFGIGALKVWAKNILKMEMTPEMDKAANKRMIRHIFFYWLCNLFYMACFIKNDVCKYIFGGLILLIVFMNLVSTFTYPQKRSSFEKWGMLQDFLVGVGLSVYLIYIIPKDSVKEVVIPIVAAIYGGLLTLTGVAWTIRRQDRIRVEEEKRKHKPLVFIRDVTIIPYAISEQSTDVFIDASWNIDASDLLQLNYSNEEPGYQMNYIYIQNTDLNYCTLKGLYINDELLTTEIGQVLDKNTLYRIIYSFTFSFPQEIKTVALLLVDMLDNFYRFELGFEIEKNTKNRIISIKSGKGLTEIPQSYQEDTP